MRLMHILALLPVCGVLIAPFARNKVDPFIFGMPFLLGWLALMLVLSSVVMACIYVSDRAANVHVGDVDGDVQ